MSVYGKLSLARVMLQQRDLKKTGNNKFAGYKYFELGDFMPAINDIFNNIKLCGIVSYGADAATLTIVDIEDGSTLVITSPMAEANLKGAHPIQNLGAVETYIRRYLWVTALEIVEHDGLGETTAATTKQPSLTNARFAKALEQIKEGKYSTDKLRGDFALTDEQEKLLQDMIANA